MVFKIYEKREKTEPVKEYDYFVCECGHMDLQHGSNRQQCLVCKCDKYVFQIKTNLDGWLDILRKRRETWRIKKENWNKEVDSEL